MFFWLFLYIFLLCYVPNMVSVWFGFDLNQFGNFIIIFLKSDLIWLTKAHKIIHFDICVTVTVLN